MCLHSAVPTKKLAAIHQAVNAARQAGQQVIIDGMGKTWAISIPATDESFDLPKSIKGREIKDFILNPLPSQGSLTPFTQENQPEKGSQVCHAGGSLGKDRSYRPLLPKSPTGSKPKRSSGRVSSPRLPHAVKRYFEWQEKTQCDPGFGECLDSSSSGTHDWAHLRYRTLERLSYKLYGEFLKEKNFAVKNGMSADAIKKIKPHSLCSCNKFIGFDKGRKRRDTIDVYYHAGDNDNESRFSFVGVQHCGGSLTCPVCGSIIAHRRIDEIRACANRLLDEGYNFLLWTLTAHHDRTMDFGEFVKKFSEAVSLMHADGTFKRFRKRHHWDYYVTASETTFTDPLRKDVPDSGWHFHKHRVIFVKGGYQKSELDKVSRLWCRCLKKVGLYGAYDVASRFDKVDDAFEKASDVCREKFIIRKQEKIKILSNYIAKAVSFELASHSTKKNIDGGKLGISDLQIYAAFHSDPVYFGMYKDYIKGVKGVNFIRFSDGLLKHCNLRDVSDKEILDGEKGDCCVFSFHAYDNRSGMSDYFYLSKQGAQNLFKQIMEQSVDNGISSLSYKDNNDLDYVDKLMLKAKEKHDLAVSSCDPYTENKDRSLFALFQQEFDSMYGDVNEDFIVETNSRFYKKIRSFVCDVAPVAVERAKMGLCIDSGEPWTEEKARSFAPRLSKECPVCVDGCILWDRSVSVPRVKPPKEDVSESAVAGLRRDFDSRWKMDVVKRS